MHLMRTAFALTILWFALGETGRTQGFNQPGAAPMPMPQMGPSTGGQMPGAPPARPGGMGGLNFPPPQAPPPAPGPSQGRQNYADELTDFGVPPQAQLQTNVGSPTPTTIPGAHVITTAEMKQAVGSDILFIDVLEGPPHPSLPGALMMPGAGSGGSFDDANQQKLWTALSQATQMNPNRPIAFLCAGSRCWESYNAALRAVQMGFKVVLWYRGGLAAWQAAGLPFGNTGGGGPTPPRSRPGFGSSG